MQQVLLAIAVFTLALLPSAEGWSVLLPEFPSRGVSSRSVRAPAHSRATLSALGTLRCSLYDDQEKIIVARGVTEESLMPPPAPLEAAKRGSAAGAGGIGFGAASTSKKGISKQNQAEAKLLAKELRREGVVRIDDVLSHETADELLEFVKALRKQSTDDVESGRLASLQRCVPYKCKNIYSCDAVRNISTVESRKEPQLELERLMHMIMYE